jgi:hypothetical protein
MDYKRSSAFFRPHTLANSDLDWMVQRVFDQYAADATWVVTSRPIFAFRANKPVPPALAVTSWKRFASALLPPEQVVGELRKYRPEVVLLTARWPLAVRTAVREELSEGYRRVWYQPVAEIWVRNGQ